jgi:hypothetical protein
MEFPEGANTKPPKGYNNPLEAFYFQVPIKPIQKNKGGNL